MRVFEITFNENQKVSLVKSPAIEETLVKFAEQNEDVLYFTNDEKQVIYSVAMIPNKMIFRKDVEGQPANVFYTEDTIAKFQQDYFRINANSGTNLNHAEFNTEGIFPFENWIVENPEQDKSRALGLNAPKGSLVMGFKIDNPDVWQDIKNGNLDGLSVEGKVLFKEQLKTITMNKQSILNDIKSHQIKMAADLKQFGDVYAMALESGEIVSDKDGNPKVDFEFEQDGKKYFTDNVGSINKVEDVVTEVAEIEAEAETEVETVAEEIEDKDETIKELQTKLADAEAKLTDLQAEKVKAETELVKMQNETPAVEPIKNITVQMKREDMSPLERRRFDKQNF